MKTKKCNFCAEEILVEAIKCKHCGEFLKPKKQKNKKKSSKRGWKIALTLLGIIAIIFVYFIYAANASLQEYERNVSSYELRTEPFKLPSGKVIDLSRVPQEYKYEVKTYLSYKDKRDSWQKKYYEQDYDSDAEYQVGIFDKIIEEYETEHPRVRENSYLVQTISE